MDTKLKRTNTTIWSAAEREAWRLPQQRTVSEWADRHRVLDSRSSAEYGPWRTDRTPYLRAIMDAYSDTEVEEIDVIKPTQAGVTEALFNMLGWTVDCDPAPTGLMEARDDDFKGLVENRLRPMVEKCEALMKHITSGYDMGYAGFSFDNMPLYFMGSNSPAASSSKPIKNMLFDEIKDYPPFAGKVSNPLDRGKDRTDTFPDRKLVRVSSLLLASDLILQYYALSNQQQYYIPCHRCGEFRTWKWIHLICPPALRNPDEIRKKIGAIYYRCEVCRAKIEFWQKQEHVAAGVWVPRGQKILQSGQITDSPRPSDAEVSGIPFLRDGRGEAIVSRRHCGFEFNALILPWEKSSWNELMAEWFEANTPEGKVVGKLMHFRNNRLVEPWEDEIEPIKEADLFSRRGDFSAGTVPDSCLMLTAGTDYHKNEQGVEQIYYEVRGFGLEGRRWVIKSGVVTSWQQHDKEIWESPFPWSNPEGPNKDKPMLSVVLEFVDSGFEADIIYRQCRRRPRQMLPTKGASTDQRTPLAASDLDKATARRLRNPQIYKGMVLINVDTQYFKDEVARDLGGGPETGTKFYAEIPDYYFKHLTNERRSKKYDQHGRPHRIWVPKYQDAPVHCLDAAVLSTAAGYHRGVQFWKAEQTVKPKPKPHRPAEGEGFLDNLPGLT